MNWIDPNFALAAMVFLTAAIVVWILWPLDDKKDDGPPPKGPGAKA